MLIDKSYFFDKLSLDHNAIGANDKLYKYIDEYVPLYGHNMFGLENWDIIESNIENPEYFYLKKLLLSPINSPLACYVFWNYQFNTTVLPSGMGDVRSTTDNAHLVSNTYRMRIAWNSMVDANKLIRKYIRHKKCTSHVFDGLDEGLMFRDSSLFKKENDWGI